MFIALEGADGTGKSTLCAILAKKLEAVLYSTPPKKYLEVRERIDKNAPANEHYRVYRDGIYDASDEISKILQSNGKVVCDRYWLTTYTYHQIMQVQVSQEDFKSIVMPTLTVILSLNHMVQVERMIHRGMSIGDRRVLSKQQEITLSFYKNALEFNIPFIIIDTQRFSPEACAEIIAEAIKK